jgi:hypothetical protein
MIFKYGKPFERWALVRMTATHCYFRVRIDSEGKYVFQARSTPINYQMAERGNAATRTAILG